MKALNVNTYSGFALIEGIVFPVRQMYRRLSQEDNGNRVATVTLPYHPGLIHIPEGAKVDLFITHIDYPKLKKYIKDFTGKDTNSILENPDKARHVLNKYIADNGKLPSRTSVFFDGRMVKKTISSTIGGGVGFKMQLETGTEQIKNIQPIVTNAGTSTNPAENAGLIFEVAQKFLYGVIYKEEINNILSTSSSTNEITSPDLMTRLVLALIANGSKSKDPKNKTSVNANFVPLLINAYAAINPLFGYHMNRSRIDKRFWLNITENDAVVIAKELSWIILSKQSLFAGKSGINIFEMINIIMDIAAKRFIYPASGFLYYASAGKLPHNYPFRSNVFFDSGETENEISINYSMVPTRGFIIANMTHTAISDTTGNMTNQVIPTPDDYRTLFRKYVLNKSLAQFDQETLGRSVTKSESSKDGKLQFNFDLNNYYTGREIRSGIRMARFSSESVMAMSLLQSIKTTGMEEAAKLLADWQASHPVTQLNPVEPQSNKEDVLNYAGQWRGDIEKYIDQWKSIYPEYEKGIIDALHRSFVYSMQEPGYNDVVIGAKPLGSLDVSTSTVNSEIMASINSFYDSIYKMQILYRLITEEQSLSEPNEAKISEYKKLIALTEEKLAKVFGTSESKSRIKDKEDDAKDIEKYLVSYADRKFAEECYSEAYSMPVSCAFNPNYVVGTSAVVHKRNVGWIYGLVTYGEDYLDFDSGTSRTTIGFTGVSPVDKPSFLDDGITNFGDVFTDIQALSNLASDKNTANRLGTNVAALNSESLTMRSGMNAYLHALEKMTYSLDGQSLPFGNMMIYNIECSRPTDTLTDYLEFYGHPIVKNHVKAKKDKKTTETDLEILLRTVSSGKLSNMVYAPIVQKLKFLDISAQYSLVLTKSEVGAVSGASDDQNSLINKVTIVNDITGESIQVDVGTYDPSAYINFRGSIDPVSHGIVMSIVNQIKSPYTTSGHNPESVAFRRKG